MRTKEIITTDLKVNTASLLSYLESVDETVFTHKLNDKEWSIIECVEHIIVIEKAIYSLFLGPKEKYEHDPERKIAIIKDRFYDFESKYPAPDMIGPKGELKTKNESLEAFKAIRNNLLSAGLASDWNERCMGFKHFAFSYLTQIEWIYFSIFHADRHLHQMKNMEEKVKAILEK